MKFYFIICNFSLKLCNLLSNLTIFSKNKYILNLWGWFCKIYNFKFFLSTFSRWNNFPKKFENTFRKFATTCLPGIVRNISIFQKYLWPRPFYFELVKHVASENPRNEKTNILFDLDRQILDRIDFDPIQSSYADPWLKH